MMYRNNLRVDQFYGEVYAVHVKGEDTYGSSRWPPIHPDGYSILLRYLEAKDLKLKTSGKMSEVPFPPICGKQQFIGYNMLEKPKKAVEEDIGESSDLRKCRRTFGQRALDESQDLYNVLGHASLATTEDV